MINHEFAHKNAEPLKLGSNSSWDIVNNGDTSHPDYLEAVEFLNSLISNISVRAGDVDAGEAIAEIFVAYKKGNDIPEYLIEFFNDYIRDSSGIEIP